jgi:hypothetical protein
MRPAGGPGGRPRGCLRAAGLLAAWVSGCSGTPEADAGVAARRDDSRVVVEVLNATERRGLARIGTRVLREAGIDVVYFGNADTTLDSTRVLVRRSGTAAGNRVARALGLESEAVALRADTLLRVDVTVLLGRDWMPPPSPRP